MDKSKYLKDLISLQTVPYTNETPKKIPMGFFLEIYNLILKCLKSQGPKIAETVECVPPESRLLYSFSN